MNGLSSLLSNDLQRGYEAGLASLVPPRRMAEGGANDADSGAYEYTYDPETMTYKLVEKKPAEKIAAGESAGDSEPGGFPAPTSSSKASGKGLVGDLQGLGKGIGKGLQGLMGFISQGGLMGVAAKGIAQALGIPGFGGQTPGASGLAGLGISNGVSSIGGTSLGGVDTSGGFDTSGGMGAVGVGGLGSADTAATADNDAGMSAGQEGISVIAKGGVVRAAKGMSMEDNSFILPADVVAAMGNGSSQAGLQALRNNMGPEVQMIRGDGDGMSDSIPANIAGTQPALISDGEAYVPPGVVQAMGGGDMSKGAKNLYAVMDEARKQAYGRTKQANQIDPNKVITKAMKA